MLTLKKLLIEEKGPKKGLMCYLNVAFAAGGTTTSGSGFLMFSISILDINQFRINHTFKFKISQKCKIISKVLNVSQKFL